MDSTKKALLLVFFLSFSLLALREGHCQVVQPNYVYRDIELPGFGLVTPSGINNLGQVVGTLNDATGRHGFLLQPQGNWNLGTGPVTGTVTILDHPDGEATFFAVNDEGSIVGSVADGAGGRKGFIYSGGTYRDVVYPGATITEVRGINNAGVLVGYYVASGETTHHGFVFDGTNYSPLDLPGATATELHCVSNNNRICASTPQGSFLIEDGELQRIDVAGAQGTDATATNVNGRVIGNADYLLKTDGFLYDGFTYRVFNDTDQPGGLQYPNSINDRNAVVGVATPTFNSYAYYAYDQSTVQPQTIAVGLQNNGASYEIMLPANWNGDLVLYAHGIVDPAQPLQLPSNNANFPSLAQGILNRGYALAFSSYAQNGYAVQNGIDSTVDLKKLFANQFGAPQHTFITGHSEGGLVTLALAEQHPQEFTGALAMCGPIGGSLPELQYLGDVRALYDALFNSYPYKLPGSVANPVALNFQPGSSAFNGVASNLILGLLPLYPTIQLTATGKIPAADTNEAVAGAVLVVGYSVTFGSDLLLKAGGQPYGNNTTSYHDPLLPQLDLFLNLAIVRVAPNPVAMAFVQDEYTPSGNLQIPLYTLHTTRDPLVPVAHEDLYAQVVSSADAGNLFQKKINRWGHCQFTDNETLSAFDSLVNWVKTGIRPN